MELKNSIRQRSDFVRPRRRAFLWARNLELRIKQRSRYGFSYRRLKGLAFEEARGPDLPGDQAPKYSEQFRSY